MNFYQQLSEAIRSGDAVALATIVQVKGSSPAAVGSKMLVWRNGKTIGTVGGGCLENDVRLAALDCMESGRSKMMTFELSAARAAEDGLVCGGVVNVFVESLAAPQLFLMGGGHISSEISGLAKRVGFRVTIMDDRDEYVNRDRFPEVDETISRSFEEFCRDGVAPKDAYIVIATRGHNYDGICLEWALGQNARYVGMIGSKTKRDLLYEELRGRGVTDEQLKTVHTPVGLEIGAETREEIGVSVVAEMIKVRRLGRS